MKRLTTLLALAAGLSVVAVHAHAIPIRYEGTLTDGVARGGELKAKSSFTDPAAADYWRFWASPGDTIQISVARKDANLDPVLVIYEGIFTDTDQFTDHISNFWLVKADDELPPAVEPGLRGDPCATTDAMDPGCAIFSLTLPEKGLYTAAVVNARVATDPDGDGLLGYLVTGTGVAPKEFSSGPGSAMPEPGAATLFGFGLLVASRFLRRR